MSSIALILLAAASTAAPPAADYPRPKIGLWSFDAVLGDGREMHGKMCVGAALPPSWKAFSADMGEHCKVARRRDGDQVEGEFTCTFDLGASVSVSHMRFTLGSRMMRMTMDTDIKGQDGSVSNHVENVSAYVGPCPSTLKPGQMQDASGQIIDLGIADGS
jgi:hypothetical protein